MMVGNRVEVINDFKARVRLPSEVNPADICEKIVL